MARATNKSQSIEKLNRLLDANERLLLADATEKNIEKSNAASEKLADYVLQGATQKQIDAYFRVSDTFKDPDELREISHKIFAEKQKKQEKSKNPRKTQPKKIEIQQCEIR